MITPSHVDLATYIIDTSEVPRLISDALRTSKRGRPQNARAIRMICIGMFLSVHTTNGATLTEIWQTLTKRLCRNDQVRLGLTDETGKFLVTETQIEYVSKRYPERLAYGPAMDTEGLNDEQIEAQREFRANSVRAINNALLDVFDLDWDVDLFALDASGLWSWGKGTRRPKIKKLVELQELEDLDEPIDADEWLASLSDEDFEDEAESNGTAATDSADPKDFRWDLEASWSAKTSKSGKKESYYGYGAHTLVQSPKKGQRDIPALIRRIELTTAIEDVVAVSLRLLTTLPRPVTDVVVDRLYNHKQFRRWGSKLIELGIRSHHDYRQQDTKFVDYEGMRWVAGRPHCPCVPEELNGLQRPGPAASRVDKERFETQVTIRKNYAFQIHTQPDSTGQMRVRCPARNSTVGCPFIGGSEMTAIQDHRPLVEGPVARFGAEKLPACCTQETVTVRPPDTIAKHYQFYYWGTSEWAAQFDRRTFVEGFYGNIKNKSTEDVCRGFTRGIGLAWMNLVAAMAAASYNLRILRNWADRQTRLRPELAGHPLLAPIEHPIGYDYVFE